MATQLNYSFITRPNLGYLTAGHTAELEFTVSNPGAAVTLFSLVFTFPCGSAASDLCASVSDVSAPNLPGAGWTASTDKSGNFVLTPPGDSISIGLAGLAFTLSIQVNSQVGVVNLNSSGAVQSFTIEEITSARKDYWSPPDPLSKFPAAFQFSNLSANPSIAQQGEAIVLSWTGTSGAVYMVNWPKGEATYSGSQPGQPPVTKLSDPSFPPTGSGQTLRAGASQTVVFSVTAEYSSGGQTLSTAPLVVPVGVNLNAPTITSFAATWQGPLLALNWATENATSVEIPAITTEPQLPNPKIPLFFTPSSTEPLPSSIKLTAANDAHQTASQTLHLSYQPVAGSPVRLAGENTTSIAVSPDSGRIFVALDEMLTVLDARTLQPLTGSPVPLGDYPMSVAVSPDGTRVFVATANHSKLFVLDGWTLEPIPGSPVSVGQYPNSVAVSPDGRRVYVATVFETTITVLDAMTLKPISGSPFAVGNAPISVAVSPDGMRLYGVDGGHTLTVFNARTLRPIGGSPVRVGDRPRSVAVSPDSARVFVPSFDDKKLTVIDGQTLKPISGSPFPVGEMPISVAVSPDGARVFVANSNDNMLTVLDAGTLQPISGSLIRVSNASSVAVSPDNTRVYVTSDRELFVLTPAFGPAAWGMKHAP